MIFVALIVRAIAYCIIVTIYYIFITKRILQGKCQSNQRGDYDDKGRDKDAIGAIGGGTGA